MTWQEKLLFLLFKKIFQKLPEHYNNITIFLAILSELFDMSVDKVIWKLHYKQFFGLYRDRTEF